MQMKNLVRVKRQSALRAISRLSLSLAASASVVLPFLVITTPSMAEPTAEDIAEDTSSEMPTTTSDETEISAEAIAKVEELLRITDAGELNFQVMETMIDQFRLIVTDIPDDWWDRFIDKIDYEELDRLIIPIYARRFTIEELDAIIAFYKTPEGQAVLEKMPLVLQDSVAVGQHWGAGIAQQIIDELEAEGYAVPDEPFVL